MSVFGTRLKILRGRTGQTQVEVGKALGKSRESVKKYEKGERNPDLEAIAKLAKHFDISADYILGITDVSYRPGGTIPICPEYREFEEYIADKEFLGYERLAVKMFVNKLEIEYMESLIDKIIEEKE